MRESTRRVLVARREGKIVEPSNGFAMPPNQAHRAAVAKLLVHPSAAAWESPAREHGNRKAGPRGAAHAAHFYTVTASHAETLYRSMNYIAAGVIPRFARGSLTPDLEDATLMYKELPLNDSLRSRLHRLWRRAMVNPLKTQSPPWRTHCVPCSHSCEHKVVKKKGVHTSVNAARMSACATGTFGGRWLPCGGSVPSAKYGPLFVSERDGWIYSHGAIGRNHASQQSDGRQQNRNTDECCWIGGLHLPKFR